MRMSSYGEAKVDNWPPVVTVPRAATELDAKTRENKNRRMEGGRLLRSTGWPLALLCEASTFWEPRHVTKNESPY